MCASHVTRPLLINEIRMFQDILKDDDFVKGLKDGLKLKVMDLQEELCKVTDLINLIFFASFQR